MKFDVLRALRHRNFRLFFCGQSVSLVGTWMTRLATSLRPRISPASIRHFTWPQGLRPTASQTDSGRVMRRFLSSIVAFMEGLSLKRDPASSDLSEANGGSRT